MGDTQIGRLPSKAAQATSLGRKKPRLGFQWDPPIFFCQRRECELNAIRTPRHSGLFPELGGRVGALWDRFGGFRGNERLVPWYPGTID